MHQNHKNPLITLGMPAFNAEQFIGKSLDSLLAQDYENFELIISDNASSDGTGDICRLYQSKDKRVRYFRNESNLGSAYNFNRLVELSSGQFFMWTADHDLWHPKILSKYGEFLSKNPNTVLVYSLTEIIDKNDLPLMVTPDRIDTSQMKDPLQRFLYLIWNLHWCNMIYGMVRTKSLRDTRLFQKRWGSDLILLAQLSLLGPFAQIPEILFYRRENRPPEETENLKQRVLSYMDPHNNQVEQPSLVNLYRDMRNGHLDILNNMRLNYFAKLYAAGSTLICFQSRFGVKIERVNYLNKFILFILSLKLHLARIKHSVLKVRQVR